MLDTILQNCFLYRLIAWLRQTYHKGALAAFFARLRLWYQSSLARRVWERFLSVPCRAGQSLWGRFLRLLDRACTVCGRWLEQSALMRLWRWAAAKCRRAAQRSLVLKAIHTVGVRGWILITLGLYLPLDYLFRSVLSISFLSSVWDEMLILFALGYLILRKMTTPALQGKTRANTLECYILLFFAVGFLLMMIHSPIFSIAVAGYRAQVQYMIWFLLALRLIENDRDFALFYGTLLCMGTLIALHGIYQFIVAAPIPSSWVSQTEMSVRTRVYSLTGSPNIMGCLMVLLAPLAAAVAYWAKKRWVKVLAMGCTGLMCLACLFTFSKGAWLGLIVAVVVFSLLLDKRLLALMGSVGAAALVLVPSVANRITYLFTADYAAASARGGRAVRWATGLELLHNNDQWFGFGLGRFGGAVAMQNQVLETSDTFSYFYMDNYYLKTLVEMGYVGLFFFLLLLLGLMIWGLRSVGRTRQTSVHPLAVGILSALSGVLVHCYFENIFEVPYMMGYFWAMAAALIYLGFFRPARK